MKRLFLALLLLAACDPDLTPVTTAGADAGAETGAGPGPGPGPDPGTDGGDAVDGGTDATTDDEAGAPGRKIDGDNDFSPGEKFATSSTATGYEGFIAWDAKNLYFGMSGNDIGPGADPKKWLLIYIEGATGTTQGVKYDDGGQGTGQQPTLPFSAGYHLGFKTDLSHTNKSRWDGGAWVDAGVTLLPVAMRKGSFVEISLPRAAIGDPATVKVHMSVINEAAGSEWTYSAVPASSITDGPDPAYSKYFEFDLNDLAKAPNTYVAKP